MNEEIWLRTGVRLGISKWVCGKNLPYAALVCLTPDVVESLVQAIMEKLRKPAARKVTENVTSGELDTSLAGTPDGLYDETMRTP